jgi:hypothetical protein
MFEKTVLCSSMAVVGILMAGCVDAENGAHPATDALPGHEVTVSGRRILVNGSPYQIRGLCYAPVPKGETATDFRNLEEDLKLMVEAGVNTIRVYVPIDDEEVLDAIHDAGIKIIMGFGFNQNGVYDIWSGSFTNYINKYKHHEAILMWELGNEYNYHPEWFGSLEGWYHALTNAAGMVHEIDPSHPVATAHGELPDDLALESCPNVDVWGMNVYRWDNPEALFAEWAAVSPKPMYLSEAGADSFMTTARDGYEQGENELAQADATRRILESVFRNRDVCSGVAVFQFTDGWWKAGNPDVQDQGGSAPNSSGVPYDGAPNEEYWGITDIDRNKKLAFDVVKEQYNALINE